MAESERFDLNDYIRRLAREEAERVFAERGASADDEWLDVPAAAKLAHTGEWHIRQFIKKLQAEGSPDVYQPNPGRPPLRVRRSALRNLRAA